jgi:hypothetical protein
MKDDIWTTILLIIAINNDTCNEAESRSRYSYHEKIFNFYESDYCITLLAGELSLLTSKAPADIQWQPAEARRMPTGIENMIPSFELVKDGVEISKPRPN